MQCVSQATELPDQYKSSLQRVILKKTEEISEEQYS